MIAELPSNEFEKARGLFAGEDTHVAINATIDGNCPGRIFVDDPTNPSAAFIWNDIRYGFLAGDPDNEAFVVSLSELLAETLLPEAESSHDPTLILYPYPKSWHRRIKTIAGDYSPTTLHRRMFSFNPAHFTHHDWTAHLPKSFRMQQIDAQMLADEEGLAEEMDFLWGNREKFLQRGFGFCLRNGGEIISTCFSAFVSGNQYEISITTHPQHRKRGFGTLTASAYIERCLQSGIEPVWQCWHDNAPSVGLAQKLGFVPEMDYPVYLIELNPSQANQGSPL